MNFLSDRLSTSIVYKGKKASFTSQNDKSLGTTYEGRGSYILNPFEAKLLCAYGGDGHTRGKTCYPPGVSKTCLPACIQQYNDKKGDSRNEYDQFCASKGGSKAPPWCDGHPYKPSDLGILLDRDRRKSLSDPTYADYNEAVLDGFHHNAALPNSIEAFVFSCQAGDSLDRVKAVHEEFLNAYGLTSKDVPLVSYMPEATSGEVFSERVGECPSPRRRRCDAKVIKIITALDRFRSLSLLSCSRIFHAIPPMLRIAPVEATKDRVTAKRPLHSHL